MKVRNRKKTKRGKHKNPLYAVPEEVIERMREITFGIFTAKQFRLGNISNIVRQEDGTITITLDGDSRL